MRKDIREGVMIYVINEIKPNYAALAKQYDCDYRTVKNAYEEAKGETSTPTPRKKRPSKLDPYKEIIQDKVKGHCIPTVSSNLSNAKDLTGATA